MRNLNRLIPATALILVILALWEKAGRASTEFRLFFSTPSLSTQYLITHFPDILTATVYTLLESVLGLVAAAVTSFLLMLPCFFFPRLLRYVMPPLITSQTIPLITLAPLFIVLFGINMTSKVFMAALLCFFPIFISIANAYISTPREVKEMTYIYNAPVLKRVVFVDLPLAQPGIFAGLKVSATLCVIGAIVAEFNGAESGLGRNLFIAAKRLDAELMIVSIVLSSLIGLSLYHVISAVERKIGFWYLQTEAKEEDS